ncbi:MAG TPA: SPOR domain-containing protein [Planctomycetota bacterium]|nr:SPOR domain-containing protein [Planctomycetota bacterium]
MPEDNQDLFNVMDSALKRQGEGRAQRFRGQGEARQSRPGSGRGEARDAGQPAGPVPGMPEAPAMPSAVGPAQPVQPAQASQAPQTFPVFPPVVQPPVAPGEQVIPIPEYQRLEGQPNTQQITRRLYPMPESSRVLPAGGSLSPGQVLRGTVFAGNRFRPQPGQAQGPAVPPGTEPEAAPPMAAEAAPPQEPPFQAAAPAPSAVPVPSGPPSTRQVPARGIAAGTLRSRPSAILSPSVRPSGVMAPQGPGLSNRYEPPPSQPAGGFMVRTEVASVLLVCVVLGLVVAFLLGHSMGESSALRKGAPDRTGLEKPPVVNAAPPAITDLDRPPPPSVPAPPAATPPVATPPVATPPATPAAPAGKYTMRVRGYRERASADNLAAQLKKKHFDDVRVVQTAGLYLVVAGHFEAKTDAAAKQLRAQLIKQVELPKGSAPLNPEVILE